MQRETYKYGIADPGIYTQMLKEFGVVGLQVDELTFDEVINIWDKESVQAMIMGWANTGGWPRGWNVEQNAPPIGRLTNPQSRFWFAEEHIPESSGTVALLNAVMNIPEFEDGSGKVYIGWDSLFDIRAVSLDLRPHEIGEIVSRNPRFIQIHNSFTKSSPFPLYPRDHQNNLQRTEGYHFLTFAPIDGAIYELDGHNKRALNLGYYVRNWVEHMPRVIKNRSRPFPDGTDFRYFCIRTDHVSQLERVLSLPILPGWTPELIARREGELERRRQQRAEYNRDNQLRRQNLMPAVLQLFVALAKSGLLDQAIEASTLWVEHNTE